MVALQHKQRHHLVSTQCHSRHSESNSAGQFLQGFWQCSTVGDILQVQQYITVPQEQKVESARAAAISPFMDRFYRNLDAYGRG